MCCLKKTVKLIISDNFQPNTDLRNDSLVPTDLYRTSNKWPHTQCKTGVTAKLSRISFRHLQKIQNSFVFQPIRPEYSENVK